MPKAPERWLLACDIDDTLLPTNSRSSVQQAAGVMGLRALTTAIQAERLAGSPVAFGTVTGRTIASHRHCEAASAEFRGATRLMDFKVTSVGAEVHLRKSGRFVRAAGWPPAHGWRRHDIFTALEGRPELKLQPSEAQGDYKLSFDVRGVPERAHGAYVKDLAGRLAACGLRAEIIFSGGMFLDLLPKGVHKGAGLRYAAQHVPVRRPFIAAAGDSMNDREMLAAADLAILPSNAHDTLKTWARRTIPARKLHIAGQPFAAGVLEGVSRLCQA